MEVKKEHTGGVIIFHHSAGVDELEGMIGQLGVVCELLSDVGKLCIWRREREVEPVCARGQDRRRGWRGWSRLETALRREGGPAEKKKVRSEVRGQSLDAGVVMTGVRTFPCPT